MTKIELRESDMQRARNLNRKNGWGLTADQMKRIISAYEKGNDYKRALIEYRLTDVNYHNEIELLKDGKFNELRELVKEW
ncbi:hypothetical protein [Phocaeicola coprocola]|uniref:hypothetical protein n=1 Tax=Phocaeicola coprocola TaxID=310298 RepID=UPI003AF0FADB